MQVLVVDDVDIGIGVFVHVLPPGSVEKLTIHEHFHKVAKVARVREVGEHSDIMEIGDGHILGVPQDVDDLWTKRLGQLLNFKSKSK